MRGTSVRPHRSGQPGHRRSSRTRRAIAMFTGWAQEGRPCPNGSSTARGEGGEEPPARIRPDHLTGRPGPNGTSSGGKVRADPVERRTVQESLRRRTCRPTPQRSGRRGLVPGWCEAPLPTRSTAKRPAWCAHRVGSSPRWKNSRSSARDRGQTCMKPGDGVAVPRSTARRDCKGAGAGSSSTTNRGQERGVPLPGGTAASLAGPFLVTAYSDGSAW
jgi:hypothetical protein